MHVHVHTLHILLICTVRLHTSTYTSYIVVDTYVQVTAYQEQNISTPPATPVLDETTKQADQVVVASTSIKRSSTPIPSVDDSLTAMFVEGKPVTIIKDASRLGDVAV